MRSISPTQLHARDDRGPLGECRDLRALLWEWLDGALDECTARRVRGHVAFCPSCAIEASERRHLLALVARTRPAVRPDARLHDRVRALLADPGSARRVSRADALPAPRRSAPPPTRS